MTVQSQHTVGEITYINPQVCLHGFTVTDEGDETYADPEEATAWCVYVRWQDPRDEILPYEITSEEDFETFAEAEARAASLADRHGGPVFFY